MLSVGRSSACHITFADPLVPSELCRIHVSLGGGSRYAAQHSSAAAPASNYKIPNCPGGGKVVAAQGVAALRVQLPAAVAQWPHVAKERKGVTVDTLVERL